MPQPKKQNVTSAGDRRSNANLPDDVDTSDNLLKAIEKLGDHKADIASLKADRLWMRVIGGVAIAGASTMFFYIMPTNVQSVIKESTKSLATTESLYQAEIRINKEISGMTKELAVLTATIEASKPQFGARLPSLLRERAKSASVTNSARPFQEAVAFVAKAQELGIKSDPTAIAAAGQEFVRRATGEKNVSDDKATAVARMLSYQSDIRPEVVVTGFQRFEQTAIFNLIAQIAKPNPGAKLYGMREAGNHEGSMLMRLPANATEFLKSYIDLENALLNEYNHVIVSGYTVTLDDIVAQNITFVNSTIKYSGGRTVLKNVSFQSCEFVLSVQPATWQFASAAFASPAVDFKKV